MQYNIPIELFVMEAYPKEPPKLYVRPTSSESFLIFTLCNDQTSVIDTIVVFQHVENSDTIIILFSLTVLRLQI